MSNTAKILILALVAIAAIAICTLAVVLLIPLLGDGAEATPTIAVVETAPATATEAASATPTPLSSPTPAVDNAWERIKAAGKIVIGTSADYPPFEYYVDEVTIDGFDIALMDEIGRRLDVQVE